MKRILIIISVIVSLNVTICFAKTDTIALNDIHIEMPCVDKDSLTITGAVAVDFKDKTDDKWTFHDLIELLAALGTFLVPLFSFIWTYYTDRQNKQNQIEQENIAYKRKRQEKFNEERTKRLADVLAKLCELDSNCRDGQFPQKGNISQATNLIITNSAYLGKDIFIIANKIIAIIERNATPKTGEPTRYNEKDDSDMKELLGRYVAIYSSYTNNE